MNIKSLKAHAQKLKIHTLTVYFAARDPNMPVFVRLLAIIVAAYALSPIDLIPDFIPVIGYLDDLIIVPLGLALVIRFTPPKVMEAAQLKAAQSANKPVSYGAAAFCIVIWVIAAYFFMRWLLLTEESQYCPAKGISAVCSERTWCLRLALGIGRRQSIADMTLGGGQSALL
jgi:uncharacterized membrane protein YkvA (DUF1232 family)